VLVGRGKETRGETGGRSREGTFDMRDRNNKHLVQVNEVERYWNNLDQQGKREIYYK